MKIKKIRIIESLLIPELKSLVTGFKIFYIFV